MQKLVSRNFEFYFCFCLLYGYSKDHCMLCLVVQLCPTLCDSMDCSLPGSSVHADSPGKNTGVGCHALLQGIFPTQGSNQGLLHCRRILYHLSHQGSPPYILSILKGPFRYHLLSPHFRYPDLHSTVVFHPHSRYISRITQVLHFCSQNLHLVH